MHLERSTDTSFQWKSMLVSTMSTLRSLCGMITLPLQLLAIGILLLLSASSFMSLKYTPVRIRSSSGEVPIIVSNQC